MPIHIATIGRQQSLAAVAKSVFGLKHAAAATVKNAEEVLVRANPQLAEKGSFKSGAQIVVPPVAAIAAGTATANVVVGRDAIVALAADRARQLATGTRSTIDRLAAKAVETRAITADKALRKAFVDDRPDLAEDYDKIIRSATDRSKAVASRAEDVRRALERLEADLPKALAMVGLAPADT